jgi:fucose 4-O-acetylase-like acetyltransferase
MENSVSRPVTRILWIDYAKAVGMYLVILGHMPESRYIPHSLIYSFHMPLFFFVSGYLERERGFGETVKNSVRAILIPYFLFWLIALVYRLCISFPRHPELWEAGIPVWRIAGAFFLGGNHETPWSYPVLNSLWFLPTLFLLKLGAALLRKANLHERLLFIIAITGLCAALTSYFSTTKYLRIGSVLDSAIMAFPFFIAGSFIKKNFTLGTLQAKSPGISLVRLSLSILGFVALYFLLQKNYTDPSHATSLGSRAGDISALSHGANVVLYYIFAFLGIGLAIFFSSSFRREYSIIRLASEGAIVFLGLQWLVYATLIVLFSKKLLLVANFEIIAAALIPVITFLILCVVTIFLKRYCPIFLGGRVKPRNRL